MGKEKKDFKNEKRGGPAVLGLVIGLVASLSSLILYLGETDFSDDRLFLLLSIIRYSTFFVLVFSAYLIIASIVRFIRQPNVLSVLGFFLCIFFVLYGAGVILIDTFIISLSGGN